MLMILLLAQLEVLAGPPAGKVSAPPSGVQLQVGSMAILQQYAKEKKFQNDAYVTLHCPPPYKKCSLVEIKESTGRIGTP